jgi:hypothetical protein
LDVSKLLAKVDELDYVLDLPRTLPIAIDEEDEAQKLETETTKQENG